MTAQRINLVAVIVAIVALIVGGLSLAQSASARTDLAALQTSTQGFDLVAQRIGAAPIEAAHQTSVPNVARDPSLVPPPITRTEPATVEFTLTLKEVTAELA